jgi:Protein of unknown function (DUF1090).
MKIPQFILLSGILIAIVGSLSVHAAQNCYAKRVAIENQIRYAEMYGNTGKIIGLKKALANVNTYCVDNSRDVKKRNQTGKKTR